MYSSSLYHYVKSRDEVERYIQNDLIESGHYSDTNLSANKGFSIYQAIEGSNLGQDYPIGHKGKTKMGDYFRYLMPTVYASIEDFPEELRYGIAVSDTVDFMVDRLFDNDKINEYFTRMSES
ncbi:hypothetical protein [Pragia fontium]|nr:hypothetical protein [Pragia fontium]